MEKNNKNLNVPNLRFPEFSGEWEKYLLKSIANIYDGTHQTPRYTKIGVPFMSVEDITQKSSSEQKYISEQDFHNDFRNPPQKGDILMTRIGDIGTPCIVSTDEALGYYVSLALIRPLEKLQSSFLNYVIQSDSFKRELYKRTIHVAFPQKINKEDIGKCKLDVPSIEEQSRIGNLLSLIDERITTQRKIIEDLKKLKDAIRTKLFTSLESHCNEYDEIRNMLHYEQPSAYLVNSTAYSEDYPTPVLTANKAFILGYTDEEQGVYDKGDCIIFDDFTMDLKYVTFPFKVKSSAIKILTPRQNIDLYFIYEYLLYLGLVSEEHKRHYISEIESMNIIHPQLKEQRQISQALRSLEMQVGNAIALQNLLVKQKQHFLSRMFI